MQIMDSTLWRELFDEEDAGAHTDPPDPPSVSVRHRAGVQQPQHHQLGPPPNTQPWPHTPPIPGLALVRGFLSPTQQELLLAAIYQEGWLAAPDSNQAMCFGQLPGWAQALAAAVPSHLLGPAAAGRTPLFDQLIANRYSPGEGLSPHVDLLRFQDGIVVLSLGTPALMAFTPAPSPTRPPASPHRQHCQQPTTQQPPGQRDTPRPPHQAAAAGTACHPSAAARSSPAGPPCGSPADTTTATCPRLPDTAGQDPSSMRNAPGYSHPAGYTSGEEAGPSSVCHQVLLMPGDLLLLAGEARYGWCHGLAGVEQEVLGPAAAAPYVAALAEQQGAAAMHCVGAGVQQPGADDDAKTQDSGLQGLPCVENNGKQCVSPAPGVYCAPDGGLLVVRGHRVSVTLRALQPDCELCELADASDQELDLTRDSKAAV